MFPEAGEVNARKRTETHGNARRGANVAIDASPRVPGHGSEWRETSLGAIADFISGGTPTKAEPAFWGGAIPWVSAKDMKRFRLADTEDHVTEEGRASGTRAVPAGTVLLLTRGMTLLHDVPICITSRGMTFNQDVKAVRVKPGINSAFLAYLLLAKKPALLEKVDLAGHGTGRLGTDELKRMVVVVPGKPEQEAIARVLGALDDKIDLNRRRSETLEAMARGLFKSWFVDFDPVRAKVEGRDPGLVKELADLFPAHIVRSDSGEIPDGWVVRALGSWVDALSGGTPSLSEPDYWGGDLPWISPKVMTSIHADEADENVTASAIGSGTRLAPPGATLVMVRGMGLHRAVRVSQARRAVTFNQDVKALVGRSIDSTLLLFALLDAQASLLEKVETSGHGTGKLASDVLLSYPLVMPDAATQRQLSEPLRLMNDRIAVTRGESRTLASLRDALLPKLISGELRIPDAERIVGEVA